MHLQFQIEQVILENYIYFTALKIDMPTFFLFLLKGELGKKGIKMHIQDIRILKTLRENAHESDGLDTGHRI